MKEAERPGCHSWVPLKGFPVEISYVSLLRARDGECWSTTLVVVLTHPSVIDLRHFELKLVGTVERGLSRELCKEGMSPFRGCRNSGE